MKKDSIITMLTAHGAEDTDLNIAIVEAILSTRGVRDITRSIEGFARPALINSLLNGGMKNLTTRRKIQSALQSLNNKEVLTWKNVKGTTWVKLTPIAWLECKKEDLGEKTTEFLFDCETNLKDISEVLRTEAGKLKRKAAKKASKLLTFLADKLREKTKK